MSSKTSRDNIRQELIDYLNSDFEYTTDTEFCKVVAERHGKALQTVRNLLSELRKYRELLHDDSSANDVDDAEETHRTVVINDVHIPFHDAKAVSALEKFFREEQVDALVINGDLLDCYSISDFETDPRKPLLADEIKEARRILHRWRSFLLNADIYLTEGNHEQRLERLVKRNSGLQGLEEITMPKLLKLDELGIEHRRYMEPLTIGEMTYVHGNRISKHSSYTAKRVLLDGGFKNVCVGHVHRLGCYYHTGHGGQRRAFETGHLCDVSQAGYVTGTPNWQQGFGVIEHTPGLEKLLSVSLVEVNRGRFTFGGRIFSGDKNEAT